MKKKNKDRLKNLNNLFFNHIHLYGKNMDAFFAGSSIISVRYRKEVKSLKSFFRKKFSALRLRPEKLR